MTFKTIIKRIGLLKIKTMMENEQLSGVIHTVGPQMPVADAGRHIKMLEP